MLEFFNSLNNLEEKVREIYVAEHNENNENKNNKDDNNDPAIIVENDDLWRHNMIKD